MNIKEIEAGLNGSLPPETSYLDKAGQYREEADENGATVYIAVGAYEAPEWRYVTENGVISRISFEVDMATEEPICSYQSPMAYGILALGGAQEEITLWNRKIHQLMNRNNEMGFGTFEFTEEGIHVSCRMEYDGKEIPEYQRNSLYLLLSAEDGKPHDFSIRFVMEPAE